MSVHYKFKSALEYDTVTFDGLHISVKDLKNSILQQKRIGKSTDFDLQVTNAQTKEVYEDENALIPKNTSLLIARIPVLTPKNKPWEGYGGDNTPPPKVDEGGPIAKAVDLSSLDAPEDDKIKAMMSQSTQDYDPSNYMKIRGANQMGAVPPTYRCYKCHQGGHWIKECTFGQGTDPIEIKKSTGIPRDFLVPVEGPQIQGAMMTPTGQYAVPILDLQAYNQKMTPAAVPEPKPDIPEDLLCSICTDLLTDAVMIPCCGNSFCDECIRGELLESEDHECPDCHEKDISPDTLIPNRFLRKAVANFKNTTGYIKKTTFRERALPHPKITSTVQSSPLQEPESTEKQADERTVISEADSTEQSKSDKNEDSPKGIETSEVIKPPDSSDGPPGVSPKGSPKQKRVYKDRNEKRSRSKDRELEPRERNRRRSRSRERSRGPSPRKSSHRLRSPKSPSYNSPVSRIDERSGTPTVDEPTTANGSYKPLDTTYNGSAPPGTVPSIMDQVSAIQGPPQNIQTTTTFPLNPPPIGTYPPSQGPPPTYRMPPPGAAPYLPPGPYPIPPRPLFDATRPPMVGVPPNFNFPPGSRGHRDFRRMRDRTPPGVIDDPLAAFNRMLREKDERKRRAKRRSYSRSRSRSRSFSRSPIRRRSRSPRLRRSRSRSRSFSLSRSRSRSYSASPRGSPYRRSPPPARRGHSRYKSPPPARSPLRRHRSREFEEDRDFNREDRYKDRNRSRNSRDRRSSRDREDRDHYYDNYDRRGGPNFDDRRRPAQQWTGQQGPTYYPPLGDMQSGYQNRFTQGPPRDYGPPFMNKEPPYNQPLPQTIHSIQPHRQFQDIHPPGVDDDIAPPGVDEVLPKPVEKRESPKKEEREKPERKERDRRDKERERSIERKRKHERRSRTPDRARNPSPKRRSRSRDSTDRRRKKRRGSSERDDRRKEDSEDEKSKKTKDKKKHKEKKEAEKKKKRDKKDKHKKDNKEKKPKEEFRQVIPRNVETDEGSSTEDAELLEKKRLEEEKKLEDKRMDSLREQKLKDDERHKVDREDRQHKENKDEGKRTERIHNEKDVEKVKHVKEEEKTKKIKEDTKSRKVKEDDKNKKHKHDDKYVKVKEEGKPKEEKHIKEEKSSVKTETRELEEPKPELYDDILTEVDAEVIENYGKLDDQSFELLSAEVKGPLTEDQMEEGEIKEFDDEEKDVLELHSDDIDLKAEIDKSDILAPVPEKSKWEVDDDVLTSPKDHIKIDSKIDKSGKVTNEVLKRAENAIFAKAINAIRPIEIKKISTDRAKLYSSEREVERSHNKIQVTVPSAAIDISHEKPAQQPVRLSVKERLGVKVEDTDKIINLERNRSRTISPFSRRGDSGRNFEPGDRRVELEFRNRRDRNRRSRSRSRDRRRDNRYHVRQERQRSDNRRGRSKNKEKVKYEDDKKSKKKRSRSRSESEDRKHRKKDKKLKKEKSKKKDDEKDEKEESKPTVVSKRKTTIDEANFEPDYDLESHSDEEKPNNKKGAKKHSEEDDDDDEDDKSSSSESDSSSSSEEERTRKKHRKHKKKKKKESSSSSSTESESESSDSDSKRKRKKHKKPKKKKKKSKHK